MLPGYLSGVLGSEVAVLLAQVLFLVYAHEVVLGKDLIDRDCPLVGLRGQLVRFTFYAVSFVKTVIMSLVETMITLLILVSAHKARPLTKDHRYLLRLEL